MTTNQLINACGTHAAARLLVLRSAIGDCGTYPEQHEYPWLSPRVGHPAPYAIELQPIDDLAPDLKHISRLDLLHATEG